MPEDGRSLAYRHTVSSTVVFGDLDAMGHMNNLALLRLLETGRVAYMVDTGLAAHDELTYVLARLETDFRSQGHYGDRLACDTRVARLGTTSFTMEQEIRRDDGTVLVEARSIMVALGPDQATPITVPDRWRKVIRDWEGAALTADRA